MSPEHTPDERRKNKKTTKKAPARKKTKKKAKTSPAKKKRGKS
jgi:hypothetical protein